MKTYTVEQIKKYLLNSDSLGDAVYLCNEENIDKAQKEHVLYETSDEDAPESIKDRNGEVVLDMCRVCGKAEAELNRACGGE